MVVGVGSIYSSVTIETHETTQDGSQETYLKSSRELIFPLFTYQLPVKYSCLNVNIKAGMQRSVCDY